MSSSTQVPPQPIRANLRGICGALFIGSILTASLFGLTSIQAFIYFRTHAGRWTKFYRLIVLLLWILDATQTTLVVHCVYFYLVTNLANPYMLEEVVWSFRLQIVFNVNHFISSVVRLRHAPADSHRQCDTYTVWSPHMDSWQRSCKNFPHNTGHNHRSRFRCCQPSDLATFLDVLITSSLWYLLASSRTGFSDTDCLIRKLIFYTINSGCLTSICALTSITICAVMPHSFVFFSLQFLVAKLYVNSYIALLNMGYYTKSYDASPINSFELREVSIISEEHARSSPS
ncbi:hypothetical protein EV424DRAFT_676455 [Suillus variegatus]|nr:hypothetical protein EV424DRAFT_676455 [Suillus variegatus]